MTAKMSRLAEMQARFQQRQMQEKEEKLLRLYENQQQRAFEKVSRSSSGGSSISGGTSPVGLAATGTGRVRQMFDERRQKAGIDRSYPLEPLKQTTRLNGHVTTTRVSNMDRSNATTGKGGGTRQSMTVKTSVQRTVSQPIGGKTPKTKTIRQSSNATYANGSLVEKNTSYEERDDNDHAITMLKQQQRELEMMMNNHNLSDNLEDEELPVVGIDEVDESRELSPYPNENDNYVERKNLSNGNYERGSDFGSSNEGTPTKNVNNSRSTYAPASVTKKPLNKSSSVSRPSPRTSADEKTRVSKTTSTPTKSSGTMAARQPQVAARSNTGASRTPAARATRPSRAPQSAITKDDLLACKFCQRRFAADRLTTHEEICARTLKKKRKTYDPVKHRVEGTDIENYSRKGPKGTAVKQSKPPQMPKTDWRRQHEEFISAIRSAKMAQAHVAAGGKLSDLPPPPPSLNPDYVQCPHCNRRFNEAAAARHIPKCASMLHNKPNRLAAPPKKKF